MTDDLYEIKSWEELDTHELYQLLQLRSEVFVVEQECAYQDLDAQDFEAMHLTAKAPNHKALMAYARIYTTVIDEKEYAAIGRVCTAKTYRGQGISRQLMNHAIQFITQNKELPITVSAQAYLETFYHSLGFETVSEPYLEDGIPHIRMVRET